MLVRVVKMVFKEDKCQEFLTVFNQHKKQIRAFQGCEYLELWNDINQSNIYTTYSIWKSEKDLENYRNSKLFIEVWSKTKVLFSEKPTAYSNNKVEIMP